MTDKLILLRKIREFYLQHETDVSKMLRAGLVATEHELNDLGCRVAFLVGGSLAMGIAVETSDIDLFYISAAGAFDDLLSKEDEEGYICTEPEDVIKRIFHKKIVRHHEIDILGYDDSLTLAGNISQKVLCGERLSSEGSELWRLAHLYAHYHTHRPLSRQMDPVIEHLERIRHTHPDFDSIFKGYISRDTYPYPGSRETWQASFEKYHERLGERGIPVPDEQKAIETTFLSYLRPNPL